MRALALTSLLSLAGCLVYAQPEPPYAPPPTRPPPSAPPGPDAGPQPESGPAPAPPSSQGGHISERQAVDAAFEIARERGLVVDRVRRARLDAQGRWEVELHGAYDRARLLLDARDGRLLKGKFRAQAGRPRR
jgi:hypothetical protein